MKKYFISTGNLKRDGTYSYESQNDGKMHFSVEHGGGVANCYGYPAWTSGIIFFEDKNGNVFADWISCRGKGLPANKVTVSGVARHLGLPILSKYLGRNSRWGNKAKMKCRNKAFSELKKWASSMQAISPIE